MLFFCPDRHAAIFLESMPPLSLTPTITMPQHTLFVCVLCRSMETGQVETGQVETEPDQPKLSAGQSLFDRLHTELESCDWRDAIHLQPVRCMGACNRSCVVALAAAAKPTFILSELSLAHAVPALLQFSGQYIACAEGKVPYKARPDVVKKSIHAVLPPLPGAQA